MAKCQNITPTRKKLCIGALDKKIDINDRAIVTPSNRDVPENTEEYTLFKDVWANIATKDNSQYQTLDGVSIDDTLIVTHVFIIRYLAGLSTEQFIFFRGNNYSIIRVVDIDEQLLWTKLNCNFWGPTDRPASR